VRASPPVVVDREVLSFPGSALIELPYVDKAGRSALSLLVVLFLLSSLDCQLLSELLVGSYKSRVLFSVSSFCGTSSVIPQARIDQHLEARILCLSHLEVPLKAGRFSDILSLYSYRLFLVMVLPVNLEFESLSWS
jgi:hypothetical protein